LVKKKKTTNSKEEKASGKKLFAAEDILVSLSRQRMRSSKHELVKSEEET
jgi:hypothetical protein